MIKRCDKKLFYGVPGADGAEPTFTRARHFTDLSVSKNPTEYTRQYVDEKSERNDIVGYSPSISYSFDDYANDAVLKDIVDITNEEKVGTDAQRVLIQVDFSREVDGGYYAVKRTYSVIPDSEGNDTNAYTYSGNVKSAGDKVVGVAAIETPEEGTSDNVETIIFVEA